MFLFLSTSIPLFTIQSDNRRKITLQNFSVNPSFLAPGLSPSCEKPVEDESRPDGTNLNVIVPLHSCNYETHASPLFVGRSSSQQNFAPFSSGDV